MFRENPFQLNANICKKCYTTCFEGECTLTKTRTHKNK